MRERLPQILFVLAIVFLAFVAGAAAFRLRLPPYNQLNEAFLAAYALKRQLFDYDTPYETSLWNETRDQRTGTVTYQPDRVQPGLTLFTSGHANSVFLIDPQGEILHQWDLPASRVTSPGSADEHDPFAYLRKAHLFPNGDMITFFEKVNTTPFGIAIVRMDSQGTVQWAFEEPIHHDFAIAPDGRIYALNTVIIQDPIEGLPDHYFPMMEDEVIVLSPDGRELHRASITRSLSGSPFQRLLMDLPQANKGDHLHTNNVEVVTPELARAFPYLEVDQAIISTRHGNMIVAIDVPNEVATWAIHGYWMKPHDADLLPSGNMLLFDNFGWFGEGGASRVIEFDPQTMELVWQYTGDEQSPLFSEVRSAQERLPNGNTLITESDEGRIFEVTPEGDIVWDFRTPFRSPDHPRMAAVVSWAHRVDPATLEGPFGEKIRSALEDSSQRISRLQRP